MQPAHEPRRLLIVDDDPLVCDITSLTLESQGYDCLAITDPRQVLPLIHTGDFDVVLLDILMPNLDGLELVDQIREHDTTLPILMVTGLGDVETTVDAMSRGATDFVAKPVDPSLLDLRIRRAYDLEYHRRLANTDGLTGLYNHRYLQERLAEEVVRARRYDRPLSLIMVDLDHFKTYNDAYGHPAGDEVLIAVAQTLRQVSRTSDLVARYGGEEFTLVLPETQEAEAQVVAERARECIAELDFAPPGEASRRISASFGLASFGHAVSRETLLQAADAALYQAKHAGRDRVATETVRTRPDPADVTASA